MKTKNFREMTTEELSTKLKDLKVELFNLRFSQANGTLEQPSRVKELRKAVARMKTILRERELEI